MLSSLFVAALAFNAASLNSVYNGGPAWTANDPLLGSVGLVTLWTLLTCTKGSIHIVCCAVVIMVLGIGGVLKHCANADLYATSEAYHSSAWIFGVCLNALISCILARRVAAESRYILAFCAMCVVASASVITSPPSAATSCTDKPFFQGGDTPPGPHLPFQFSSQYVTMSDGVKLAVDTYLPAGHKAGTKLPVFLHLTRYHRAEKRSWLTQFTHFFGYPPGPSFPMRSLHFLNMFVPSGYAFVSVDVRGTGASFGSRPVDLMPREVLDYREMSDWTLKQPFCNGKIGTGGISYDGITGALMAAQGNIQAAALLFAPGDIYEDIAVPGGVPCTGFIDMYGKFTSASERNEPVADVDNELPMAFKVVSSYALKGVDPVDGDETGLAAALEEHGDNFDMTKAIRDPLIHAKDDVVVNSGGVGYDFNAIGITEKTFDGLKEHKVAVYSVAGYFDSGSIRSAARMHNSLESGQSKLTIGPWSHGCRACYTPVAKSTAPSYPIFADVKRFFDCKLKDECSNLPSSEPTLHYFLSGKDAWRSSNGTWPPLNLGLEWERMGLCGNGELGQCDGGGMKNSAAHVDFNLDFAASSGVVSRWNLVQHLMKKAVTYPSRAAEAKRSVIFTAPPRGSNLEIVGSVAVSLELELVGGTDTVIFAYLEDFNPATGSVTYVTEGQLRASHRANGAWPSPGSTVGSFEAVQRSYTRSQMVPFETGKPHRVEFMLEPVAYELPANHQLRLALAGADKDNFLLDNVKDKATSWRIHTPANGGSAVHLPAAKKQAAV